MKIKCYALHDFAPKLTPASPRRDWMDGFADRHPYRCLPMAIANASGWELLCPVGVTFEWNGGPRASDISVTPHATLPGNLPLDHFFRSHFSGGIITFHTGHIFMTDPGWDLIATGPFNRAKHGASALSGVMESDWLPYPFTMNWQLTQPGRVTFAAGEPFCLVFPVAKQACATACVEIHRLADHPDILAQFSSFRSERAAFMEKLNAGDEDTARQGWQRHYFVGRHPDGQMVDGHLNKLRLAEPVDLRK